MLKGERSDTHPELRDDHEEEWQDWERRFIVAQAARWAINGAKNLFLKNLEALALELALGPTHPLQSGDGLLHGGQRCLCRISTISMNGRRFRDRPMTNQMRDLCGRS